MTNTNRKTLAEELKKQAQALEVAFNDAYELAEEYADDIEERHNATYKRRELAEMGNNFDNALLSIYYIIEELTK